METARLLIRPLEEADEDAFVRGIADRALRTAYGFPPEMGEEIPPEIFRRFRGLSGACALAEKTSGTLVGFLLDAEPVFPPYQRQGYMEETLRAYIPYLFRNGDADYIHCGHFTDNGPGRAILRKLGFREYARHAAGDRIIIDRILIR